MNRNNIPRNIRKRINNKTDRSNLSTKIALFSLAISIVALISSGYFSLKTLIIQSESNAIQKKYSEVERNSKIAELVTKYNKIRHAKIDFKNEDRKVIDKKVIKRSEEILLTLNSLFLVTRDIPEWDIYIQKESEWSLGSLKRRSRSIRCSVLSSEFRNFIFNNEMYPIDECIICNDTSCGE